MILLVQDIVRDPTNLGFKGCNTRLVWKSSVAVPKAKIVYLLSIDKIPSDPNSMFKAIQKELLLLFGGLRILMAFICASCVRMAASGQYAIMLGTLAVLKNDDW